MFNSSHYSGIDIDPKLIKKAKRLYSNYSFYTNKIFNDNSFDLIFIHGVLHHLSDNEMNHYLKYFKKLLKPNGIIILFEAYLSDSKFSNWFMKRFDKGKYIRTKKKYFDYFKDFNITFYDEYKTIYLFDILFFVVRKEK